VTYIDWRRRRCFVEPADGGGKARWTTGGWSGLGFELSRSMREVLLGADPPVTLTRRAVKRLAQEREERSSLVHPGGSVIVRDRHGDDLRWWTWAGFRANATLAATLTEVVDPVQRFDDSQIRLRGDLTRDEWQSLIADAGQRLCLPEVNKKALDGLKFSEALPERLALATLASRLADLDGATAVLQQQTRFVRA
jgi:ATP-dependent Lhr-like helicase